MWEDDSELKRMENRSIEGERPVSEARVPLVVS